MTRPNLVGYAEVAAILGVPRSNVGAMRRDGRLPAPRYEFASGPVWYLRDIEPVRRRLERKRARRRVPA